MRGHWWAVVAVWVVTLGLAVPVATLAAPVECGRLAVLLLAGAVVLSFFVQLAIAERVGFVARLTASTIGAAVIALAAGLIGLLR